MLILGIESSCDDTSVCLLDASDKGHKIIALTTASQINIHEQYGGVVPEVAGRLHAEAIAPLIEKVLKDAGQKLPTTDATGLSKPEVIAVTAGPGLMTSLLVGVEAARTLSYAWNIPLVATNHIDGHMHSVELTRDEADIGSAARTMEFPAIALVVSGGHTELLLLKNHGDYTLLGATVDDAAGECFDKVAKILGLAYPGGPKISKLAATGNTTAIQFPRPMLARPKPRRGEGGIDQDNYKFSFSGLKTSALYWLRDHTLAAAEVIPNRRPAGINGVAVEEPTINDFCASVEQAIVDVLVVKTMHAAEEYRPKQIIVAGGVAANKKLRDSLIAAAQELPGKPPVLVPPLEFCMDNGAMIAAAGYYKAQQKKFTPWRDLDADSNWRVENPK